MKYQELMGSKHIESQKYILLVYATLYIMVALITYALPNREVSVFGFSSFGSALIMPAWYTLGDAITELFGIKVARFLIWMSILACFIFAVVVCIILKVPYPAGWGYEKDFNYVFAPIMKLGIISNLCVLLGAYINAYLMSHWKVLLKGRHFFLRSIGSSAIGDFTQIATVSTVIYFSVASIHQLFSIILTTYALHIVLSIIYSVPNTFFVHIVKIKTKLDSPGVSINPFKKEGG